MAPRASWVILQSQVLRAVTWDPARSMLRVRFRTGRVYEYYDVPPEVVEHLLEPEDGSHGRYFNEAIRDVYEYRDVTP